MSKRKSTGLRARTARALDKVFGSGPSTELPSSRPSSSSSLWAPFPSTSSVAQSLPASALSLPAQMVSAHPSPVPSKTELPGTPSILETSSLDILPVIQARDEPASSVSTAWAGLDSVLHTLYTHSALFPPLQLVIGELQSGFTSFEESFRNKKEYETLARELMAMSETLDRHLQGSQAPPMMDFIVGTIRLIQKQVDFIASVQSSDQVRRLAKAQEVGEALAECDHQIQILCRQLQLNAGLGIATEQQNAQIKEMNPARLATYDSRIATDVNRRACTENTRTGVLSDVRDWLDDPSSPNVCWMNGMAGTGKTTIAYTLAQTLDKDKRLAASFFCTRTTDECRDVARIVPTIAYQLARFSSPFLVALCNVLRGDPDILSRTISKQFEQLLKEPLLKVEEMIPPGLLVVIDALDECVASDGVKLVLEMLLQEAPSLPLKFFVASRPEPSIRSKIQEQPSDSRSIYELHNVKQSDVQADIELYLQTELPSVESSQLKQLASLSGSLFIYAATAVRYIRAGNIEDRLLRILSAGSGSWKGHAEIDKLYTTILTAAFDKEVLEEDEEEHMKLVLWTAVCAWESMSVQTLAALVRINYSKVLGALEPLRSVLHISTDGSTVSTLHASFPDYMFDPARSSVFACNPEQHDEFLAGQCFQLMQEQLQFNICGLESSYIPDEEVIDLEDRISEAISPTLAYTCRYWANHLQHATASDHLHALLEIFLSGQLLFWMEVMNLKRWIGLGVDALLKAKLWIMATHHTSKLISFAEDARQFVTGFAANAISQSTPHIYVSALPFCSRANAVYEHYRTKVRSLIGLKGTGIEAWDGTIVAKWKVDSARVVAYSPNGTQITVGCLNGAIVVMDTRDGTSVGTNFEAHTDPINSVAFSPEGAYIVSGSNDRTIRIWNAPDCTPVGDPFKGHTDSVMAVAFSPDGTRVVSGSADETVRMWAVSDGTLVGAPFKGHNGPVTSIMFSPNGALVVSGSVDATVRLWSAVDGTPVGNPFEGHTGSVFSVAFSPDGTRIISGSSDMTILMWNVEDGTLIGFPFEGHTFAVNSVVFSPSGALIISGSGDHTIRMWSAVDGTPVGAPLNGHNGFVSSVVSSPDGTHIVSGSWDGTVRIWSTVDVTSIGAPFESHTYPINSVALPPDSTRTVSASDNQDARTWNNVDDTPIGAPLEGFASSIRSVAFSPSGTGVVTDYNDENISQLSDAAGGAIGTTFWAHAYSIHSVAFSPTGEYIISGSLDCTVCMWSSEDGTRIGAPFTGHICCINSVAFSPTGTHIASGSDDFTVRMWNAHDGAPIGGPFTGHTDSVRSVAFSPDGTCLASSSDDNTIRTWNASDGTPIGFPFEGHTDSVRSIAFSPDGTRIVSGSWDKTIRIWSTADGTSVGVPFEGHTFSVNSVAFSPDGKFIVSGSSDETIRMWDAVDGAPVGAPIEGHTDSVNSVAFSPDGTRIVSASNDKTVRLWSAVDGTPIGSRFRGHIHCVRSAAFSPDGTRVASGSDDRAIRMWNVVGGAPVKGRWSIAEDGWVKWNSDQLILWAPPDLTPCLPTQHNTWATGPKGTISLDYTFLLTGGDWRTCYIPQYPH